jgi:hypothetical protein
MSPLHCQRPHPRFPRLATMRRSSASASLCHLWVPAVVRFALPIAPICSPRSFRPQVTVSLAHFQMMAPTTAPRRWMSVGWLLALFPYRPLRGFRWSCPAFKGVIPRDSEVIFVF